MSGTLSWYERKAPSGNRVRSGFCGACGSPVLAYNSGYVEDAFVMAASLDDPTAFRPSAIVHRDEGHAWDMLDPDA